MSTEKSQAIWQDKLVDAKEYIKILHRIKNVACAFNVNIDAIVNVSGQKFAEILHQRNISLEFLQNFESRNALDFTDVCRGLFKCFTLGIAEEWSGNSPDMCDDVLSVFSCQRMQIGGQGGIIANLLSVCGVQKVVAHTNSLPKLQAKQFIPNENLLGFNEQGVLEQICKIDRKKDHPLIHIIFEFKKGDTIEYAGKKFVCPKSNRFIFSCDQPNSELSQDENFLRYMEQEPQDFCFLSGFHLLSENNVKNIAENIKNQIEKWKKSKQKQCVFHLEVASTSDSVVRKIIIDEIAPQCESMGLNERELIDIMSVICPQENFSIDSVSMLRTLIMLKKYVKVSRIQLHMLGLFMTIQDKKYHVSPLKTQKGMLLASRISLSRAKEGDLKKYADLFSSENTTISTIGWQELQDLSEFLHDADILNTGIYSGDNFDLVVVPTPIEEAPKSLVGMGDTISSISLLGSF